MGHTGHQVDKAHGVTDGGLLFRYWLVRLAVRLVFHHPRRAVGVPVGGATAFFVLFIVEMRLCATLLNKIIYQRDIPWLLRDFIQSHERQLNFRVYGIAMQLVFTGSKNVVDMVCQTTYHLQ
ncbi:hypothetical protein D3C73_935970 [compost metagenome]